MTRGKRWNTLALPVLIVVALINVATTFNITRISPITDKNIRTGNKMFYEKEINEYAPESISSQTQVVAADGQEDVLDANEIPVRYDASQLWRIYNITEHMSRTVMPVSEILENKFGGVIWKENSYFLDISIDKKHLKAARGFLEEHNLIAEILNSNIQEIIDMEQIMGVNLTQSEMGQRTKKAVSSGMNWKNYHDLGTIYSFMNEIQGKFPKICRLYNIGKTANGRDLKVLRISENAKQYKKIWIDGGIHAREWISPATVTHIINQLTSNWDKQPDYIKKKTWYIMPVVNPDGYVYSRTVNRLWRKNRATSKSSKCVGVDLNRNFNIGWNSRGSSSNPCSDIYRGTKAGSELETAAVVRFLSKRKKNLKSYLTFHSYSQLIVYPWSYKAAKVKNAAELQRIANTAVKRIKKKTGKVYTADATYKVLGIAGGGSDDWSRAALGTKYVYTVELRDRGAFGFVLPPNQILETAVEAFTIVDTVAKAIV